MRVLQCVLAILAVAVPSVPASTATAGVGNVGPFAATSSTALDRCEVLPQIECPATAPSNVSPPAIIEPRTPLQSGDVVTVRPGTWTGRIDHRGYQWLRCEADGSACGAAGSGEHHVVSPADFDSTLRVHEIVRQVQTGTDVQKPIERVATSEPSSYIVSFETLMSDGGGPLPLEPDGPDFDPDLPTDLCEGGFYAGTGDAVTGGCTPADRGPIAAGGRKPFKCEYFPRNVYRDPGAGKLGPYGLIGVVVNKCQGSGIASQHFQGCIERNYRTGWAPIPYGCDALDHPGGGTAVFRLRAPCTRGGIYRVKGTGSVYHTRRAIPNPLRQTGAGPPSPYIRC